MKKKYLQIEYTTLYDEMKVLKSKEVLKTNEPN